MIKLEQQVKRFFRSGFKRSLFTNAIYDAMYINGPFIAHFDKDTFHKTRFRDPNGFFATIDALKNVTRNGCSKESWEVRQLLKAYTKDYLARMDIVETFLHENGL